MELQYFHTVNGARVVHIEMVGERFVHRGAAQGGLYIGNLIIIVQPSYIPYGITHFTKILAPYTVAT